VLAERYLGEAYMWKEEDPASPADMARAVAQFNRVIELFPGTDQAAWVRFGIGEAYRIHGRYEEALARYADLLGRGAPNELRPWILLRRANALANQTKGQPVQEVAEKYREVISAHPGTEAAARALMYLGGYLVGMGRFEDAAAQYVTLLGDYTRVALPVELPKAHGELANIATWSGDGTTATRHWQAIIEDFGDSRLTVEAFYHVARGDSTLAATPQEAISVLEPRATTGPLVKQAAALLVLEALYREAGLSERAAAARERLRSQFPASKWVDDLALQIEDSARRYWWFKPRVGQTYAEGAVLAENGLLLNCGPRWQSRLKLQAAENRRLAGECAAALELYDAIRSDDPNWEEIPTAIAGIAECRAAAGDFQRAVALLDEAAALERRPRERMAILVRGAELCRDATLPEEGLALLDRLDREAARDKFPGLAARAQLTRALLWAGKGNLTKAASEFERLLDSYPDAKNERPQALLQKAVCLEGLGDQSGANSCYQQVLKEYPESAAASQAARRLASLAPK
jgi:TolA-binding protein